MGRRHILKDILAHNLDPKKPHKALGSHGRLLPKAPEAAVLKHENAEEAVEPEAVNDAKQVKLVAKTPKTTKKKPSKSTKKAVSSGSRRRSTKKKVSDQES